MNRPMLLRRAVLAACSAAAVWLIAGLLLGDTPYAIHARFENAGQLVDGGDVQVAGRHVGSISAINVTPNGLADVTLKIDDGKLTPLHVGTRAVIRAIGQAGVANRYIDLTPGPSSAATLVKGAILPTTQTAGIVDLDALLDSLDAPARRDVREFAAASGKLLDSTNATAINGVIRQAPATLSELNALLADANADRGRFAELIRTAADVSRVIAQRRDDLTAAIDGTAQTFTALAAQREPLRRVLHRSPAFLAQVSRTLRQTADTVEATRPVLRDVPAAARAARPLLQLTTSTLNRLTPALARLHGDTQPLVDALQAIPPLVKPVSSLSRSSAAVARLSNTALRATREYAGDITPALTGGLLAQATQNYDTTGHYLRATVQVSPQAAITGPLASLFPELLSLPGPLFGQRDHQRQRCPGSAAPPAPDGSNPWIDPEFCDPSQIMPASVNEP